MPRRNTTIRDRLRATIKASGQPCHICGKPIDYALPHYDSMSFVVDHVVPLARGGRDDITNALAAHRSCNRAKSDRDYAPILRTSGTLG